MSFWDGMKLWEKMLFVLACAIVCVLVYAVSRLIYNNRRILKYTKLAEARKVHLENVRSSRNVIQLKSDEIPFGIKALEAGIEVEGVVISRPATPTSSRPNQSQLTLVGSDTDSVGSGRSTTRMQQIGGRPLVYQPSPYLSLPSPLHHGQSGSSSMRSSTTSIPSTVSLAGAHMEGRRALSDPLLHNDTFRSLGSHSGPSTPPPSSVRIPDAVTLARLEGRMPMIRPNGPPRTRSPPMAMAYIPYNQYNGYLPTSRTPSRTPSPPEGPRSPTLPSVDENYIEESAEYSSQDSDSGTECVEQQPKRRPQLLTTHSTPVMPSGPMAYEYLPETARGDLSLLHTHRLSHAAEVGQLLPRNVGHSRTISGGAFLMPSELSMSPHTFVSPTMVNPVYALDIALPQPAVMLPENSTIIERRRRASSGSTQSGETSRFVEDLWSDAVQVQESSPEVPNIMFAPRTSDVNVQDKLNKIKETKRLQKKRRTGSSFEVDLEAQK